VKAKSIIKIIIDIVMSGLFIALLFAYQTGLVFHEIMGISILFLIGLHMALNRKWIAVVTKNLFSKKIKAKTALMYLLNTGLLIGIIIITITGLLISRVLLPVNIYNPALVSLHKWTAYVTAVMMGVHLFLHLEYLGVMFKKIYSELVTPVVLKTLGSAAAIVFIAVIIYYNIISAADNSSSMHTAFTANPIIAQDKKKQSSDATITSSAQAADTISLTDFLSKMYCTACNRHCPLSHPQCMRSARLVEQATAEYENLYNINHPTKYGLTNEK